jgi:hypothetical protein
MGHKSLNLSDFSLGLQRKGEYLGVKCACVVLTFQRIHFSQRRAIYRMAYVCCQHNRIINHFLL